MHVTAMPTALKATASDAKRNILLFIVLMKRKHFMKEESMASSTPHIAIVNRIPDTDIGSQSSYRRLRGRSLEVNKYAELPLSARY
jgi:hypothetical protein